MNKELIPKIVSKDLVNYISSLNLHSDKYDLYATIRVADVLLKRVKPVSICSTEMKKAFTTYGYINSDKLLFKEFIKVYSKYSVDGHKCNKYVINPFYLFTMYDYSYYSRKKVELTLEYIDSKIIEVDSKMFNTYKEAERDLGESKYMIKKKAVEHTIKLLMTKEPEIPPFSFGSDLDQKITFNKEDVVRLDSEMFNDEDKSRVHGLIRTDPMILMSIKQYGMNGGYNYMHYFEGVSGRLFGTSIEGANLQAMKSIGRELFFDGQYEIDIETSAPTILYQSYLKFGGIKLNLIEDYINDKNKYREYFINNYDLSIGEAKSLVTALFFGANLMMMSKSLVDELGYDAVNAIRLDIEMYPFFEQIDSLMFILQKQIRKRFTHTYKNKIVVTNELGKRLYLYKYQRAKAISHYYFGIERQILDVMRKETNPNLLLHDAVVCEKLVDLDKLSKKVEKETGFKVSFSYKKYNKDRFFEWMGEI